jgi:fumarate reductase flavoprotein subunit
MGINRRTFLKGGLLATTGVVAASALGGCAPKTGKSSTEGSSSSTTGSEGAWYGAPADSSSFDIVETVDVDLLICGYGSAGLMATAVAAQQGIDAVTIEKSSKGSDPKGLGVVGASIDKDYVSRGWIKSAVDPLEVLNEVARYASGWGDPRVIKTWATESGSTFDWICDTIEPYGARPFFEYDVADGTHGIWKVMPIEHYFHIDYSADVLAKAEKAVADSGDPAASVGILPTWGDFLRQQAEDVWGANVRCNTALVQLLQNESKRVTGAIAKGPDGYIQFNAAKAVILATGGYEANIDLLKQLNPDAERVCGFPMYNSNDTGDGIKAGIWAGGVKDEIPTLMTFARAAIAPDGQLGYPYTGTTCWMGDQPFPKVNLDGVRVCCETSPYDYPLHVASKQRENKLFSIWDANYEKHIAQFHTIGCSRIMPTTTTMLDGTPLAGSDSSGLGGWGVNESIIASAIDSGVIQTANTLEELATKTGINPENLKKTIENYNKMAAAGVDTEFGKPAKDLIALDTPPYYGCAFGGHILVTLDGLRIDKDMRVLDGENAPIEGLYSCGNCSGSFYAGTYPELFISNAMGRTVTFARHAVLHIKDNL